MGRGRPKKLPITNPKINVTMGNPYADETRLQILAYIAAHHPNAHIYRQVHGRQLAYMVKDVTFEKNAGGGAGHIVLAASTPLGLVEEFIFFRPRVCVGRTVLDFLTDLGVLVNDRHRATDYEEDKSKYLHLLVNGMGYPCELSGFVSEPFDCLLESISTEKYVSRAEDSVRYVSEHPVVIDKLLETDQLPFEAIGWIRSTGDYQMDATHLVQERKIGDTCWTNDDIKPYLEERVTPLVPVHPYMSVYNLKDRRRQVVHVADLEHTPVDEDAAWDIPLLGNKQLQAYVLAILKYDSGTSQDVIEGKQGGSVMLFQGEPGIGKTLTAEVMTRRAGRVLYSVQCAELGTDPKRMEGRLRTVLDRAARWGAVLLLDEADLFILKRDIDFHRAAITEAFVRVLEYHNSAMFMTTNVPIASIDKAVINRCLLQYQFGNLTKEENKLLWQALAKHYRVPLAEGTAEVMCEQGLAGRDVKRILKMWLRTATSAVATAAQLSELQNFGATNKG